MRFEWARELGVPGQPYLRRWTLPLLGGWSIRLHNWLSTDDPEAYHDHPTWFWTLVLAGGYTDLAMGDGWSGDGQPTRPDKCNARDTLERWSLRFRPPSHTHTVQEVKPGTWTLCLFGRETSRWSFFYYDRRAVPFRLRRMKRDKYFAEIGHHTPNDGRVRMRPDGSTIS